MSTFELADGEIVELLTMLGALEGASELGDGAAVRRTIAEMRPKLSARGTA